MDKTITLSKQTDRVATEAAARRVTAHYPCRKNNQHGLSGLVIFLEGKLVE